MCAPLYEGNSRDNVISWRKFGTQAYHSKYPCTLGQCLLQVLCPPYSSRYLVEWQWRVYLRAFTGTRLDALAQHAASDGHAANALSFQKSTEQLVA